MHRLMYVLTFLLLQVERAKVLSNTVKQKRKEKAGKWEVPLPKVKLGALLHVFMLHLGLTMCCSCICVSYSNLHFKAKERGQCLVVLSTGSACGRG